jgi:hypothetical protein
MSATNKQLLQARRSKVKQGQLLVGGEDRIFSVEHLRLCIVVFITMKLLSDRGIWQVVFATYVVVA